MPPRADDKPAITRVLDVYNALMLVINRLLTQNGITIIFRRDVKDVYVTVRDNNVDQALRVLKKKMQREGVFREMKNRRSYEKPSERRAREAAESTRRVRKLMRKRLEREGY
jgi:small subunit ribosomal protein S21